jgi:hypothetical protein
MCFVIIVMYGFFCARIAANKVLSSEFWVLKKGTPWSSATNCNRRPIPHIRRLCFMIFLKNFKLNRICS